MSRVPYVQPADLPDGREHLIESQTVREGEPMRVLQAIGNNVPLLKARRTYGSALRHDSGLTERQRELVILTVASTIRSRYIWHQHVKFAVDDILSKAEIEAISADTVEIFDPEDAALIQYVRRFVSMEVDDDVHATASSYFDADIIVGIGMVSMGYLGLAHGCDAFGVQLEDADFVGWTLAAI